MEGRGRKRWVERTQDGRSEIKKRRRTQQTEDGKRAVVERAENRGRNRGLEKSGEERKSR